MATGTPVLGSRIPALEEVAADAALLVDPLSVDAIVDGLRQVVTGQDLRRRLVLDGRERAGAYTWARSAGAALEGLALAANIKGR
jgi:alpha-1,3-rhamnosyl/mannosyltransferase